MTTETNIVTKKWNTLDQILSEVWKMLVRGGNQSKDPFHTPVLGTVEAGECRLRTVVLREVNEAERTLICHSDVRANKVAEISQQPRASWLFYHPEEKVQVRLRGQITLHRAGTLVDQRWAASRPMNRRCYLATLGPGTPATEPVSGLPPIFEKRTPTLAESEAGRENFVVLACRVDFMDWLYLRAKGHRRAQFVWWDDEVTATWVAP